MWIKKISKDRLLNEESNGIICFIERKNFSDETTFFRSVLSKSHVLLELGRKYSWSDHIKKVTERIILSIWQFCHHDYS